MSATDADLRFVRLTGAALDLRFGADADVGSLDDMDLSLAAEIADTDYQADIPLDRDQAVNRSARGGALAGWSDGRLAETTLAAPHRATASTTRRVVQTLAEATPLTACRGSAWTTYARDRASQCRVPLTVAAPIRGQRTAGAWATLWRGRRPVPVLPWGDGLPCGQAVASPWITLWRGRRPVPVMPWGEGAEAGKTWRLTFGQGTRRRREDAMPWGDGIPPRPGVSPHDNGGGVTPPKPINVSLDLRFSGLLPATLDLRFGLSGTTPTTETIVVPVRRIYMIKNTQTLVLVDSGDEIPAKDFRLDIDHQSFTWSWSATVPAAWLPRLLADTVGDAVELLATLNGIEFRLLAEKPGRGRQFAKTSARIAGRGRSAGLSAPYAERTYRTNADVATAQQLMAAALTENGVSLGWSLDWQITDWLVPAGAWAHTGTPMEACLAIAEAAGAYIQGHRTDKTLSILPRYPAAPWAWSGLTPDIELPEAVVTVEDIDWEDRTVYNALYLAGQKGGVLGHVVRSGTAGDKVMDMITDPLFTASEVVRQRGLAELSATGRIRTQQLTLPHLSETGIILPGKILRYVAEGKTRLGLVRGTSVEASFPRQRQTIQVESHDL